MGEQMLSVNTTTLVHNFLWIASCPFYYAHPGFHINNLFIILSVQFFMLVIINLGALRSEVTVCDYDRNKPVTDKQTPLGCYMLAPVLNWVERCIVSIIIVFFISFVPLAVQELTERGFWRAATRLTKHFVSLSPLFEVFVCQIYANSLLNDLAFGGARYIGTGRGFATARIPFGVLYSRFAGPSIYLGARSLMMLLFATITIWRPHLIYFWASLLALCVLPLLVQPPSIRMERFLR